MPSNSQWAAFIDACEGMSLAEIVAEVRAEVIKAHAVKSYGNMSECARRLQCSRSTVEFYLHPGRPAKKRNREREQMAAMRAKARRLDEMGYEYDAPQTVRV